MHSQKKAVLNKITSEFISSSLLRPRVGGALAVFGDKMKSGISVPQRAASVEWGWRADDAGPARPGLEGGTATSGRA